MDDRDAFYGTRGRSSRKSAPVKDHFFIVYELDGRSQVARSAVCTKAQAEHDAHHFVSRGFLVIVHASGTEPRKYGAWPDET